MDSNEKERSDSQENRKKRNMFGRLLDVVQSDRDLIAYKLFYMSAYGATGCLIPYLPLYYKQLGFSAVRSGILLSIRPLSCFFISPFWGFLADKYQKRRIFLFIGAFVCFLKIMLILAVQPKHQRCSIIQENSTVASLARTARESPIDFNILNRIFNWKKFLRTPERNTQLASFFPASTLLNKTYVSKENFLRNVGTHKEWKPSSSEGQDQEHRRMYYNVSIDNGEMEVLFYILLTLMVVGDAFFTMLYPVADSCLIDLLDEKRNHYGRIRLWGSLSTSFGTLVIGIFIDESTFYYCGEFRKDYKIAFYFFAAFMVICFASVFCVKIVYNSGKSSRQSIFPNIIPLGNSWPKFAFWLTSVYLGMLDGFQTEFTSWFLDDLGASAVIVGAAASLHFAFNVTTFFLANHVLKFLSYINAINLSLALYVVLFPCISVSYSPWLVLLLYSLAGVCFSISWVASVAKVASDFSSLGLGATAQGVLFGLYMGAGLWGGACLGGALISFTGIRTAYQLLAGVAFIMLIMFGVSSRMANTDDDDEQSEVQYQAILTEDLEDADKNQFLFDFLGKTD